MPMRDQQDLGLARRSIEKRTADVRNLPWNADHGSRIWGNNVSGCKGGQGGRKSLFYDASKNYASHNICLEDGTHLMQIFGEKR